MTAGEPFLRAAIVALDEVGDFTDARAIAEAAIETAAPLESIARPPRSRKRVTWAARQMAMAAEHPARAYSRLRELLAALFEPFAGASSPAAPAPEVALAMAPAALIDALAPAPRVVSRDLASTAKLDARALIAAPALPSRVLGVRAIPQASIGAYATELAAVLAGTPPADPAGASAAGSARAPDGATNAVASVEIAILRAEAIAICVRAAEKTRGKVAAALVPYLSSSDGGVRAAAIDGLHALGSRLDHTSLLAAMRDPVAAVRAAATRTISVGPFGPGNPRPVYPPEIDMALIGELSDIDGAVRTAALGAIARSPSLKGAALVEPLRAVVRRGDGDDMRTAIYLLGELGAQAAAAAEDLVAALPLSTNPYQTGQALLAVTRGAADERIVETLRACVAGPRSSAAHTAAFVLDKLGLPVPDVSTDVRLARAAGELASADRDVQRSGMSEAERLGDAAKELIPDIVAIGERVAAGDDVESKALLRKVRDTLSALGVAGDELPRPPSRLEAYLGIEPRELRVHGAYAVASIAGVARHGVVDVPAASLGLWDNGTGKRLFVVDRAQLLEFVPGRAEVAVVRTQLRAGAKHGGTNRAELEWLFERYGVPGGERVASLPIPAPLTYGWPAELAIAADLVTVWCGDEIAPYRFHIKLGLFDVLLDIEPNLGRRPRRK